MKTFLHIELASDSMHIEEPTFIPTVGSTVHISQGDGAGKRIYSGIVTFIEYDFSEEDVLYIRVKAR